MVVTLVYDQKSSDFAKNIADTFGNDNIEHSSYTNFDNESIWTNSDIIVTQLDNIPDDKPVAWTIAALGPKVVSSYSLLIKKNIYAPVEDLKIINGGKVAVPNSMVGHQIKNLNHNVNIEILDLKYNHDEINDEINLSLQAVDYEAIIIPTNWTIGPKILENYQLVKVHQNEIILSPDMGVDAILCHADNIDLRRKLKEIHHAEIVSVSNVQRAFGKLCLESGYKMYAVNCEKDLNGYYHIKAQVINNNGLQNLRISQSTTHLLAENLFLQLQII
jgi:hypothetical protein